MGRAITLESLLSSDRHRERISGKPFVFGMLLLQKTYCHNMVLPQVRCCHMAWPLSWYLIWPGILPGTTVCVEILREA